ncbi:hypothetical protein BJ912DRAFT_363224 [Pholiota molesta]|nr:hypothetical protein BJ912DRAFT_363224 [Pholiota molesta]
MPGATTSSPDIPLEIVDLIIDNVINSTVRPKYTLRACALVSKVFNAGASRHLFSKIAFVYDPYRERPLMRLRKVLEANPGLVLHIRTLDIKSGLFRMPKCRWRRYLLLLYRYQKYRLLEKVDLVGKDAVWLLQTLSNARLTTLAVGGLYASSSWRNFPERIAALLLSIAQSNPHLESLELANIAGLPCAILARAEGDTLRHLSFKNCTFRGPVNLFFGHCPAETGVVCSSLNLQSLRRLEMHSSYDLFDLHSLSEANDGRLIKPIPSGLHFPKLEFASIGIGLLLAAGYPSAPDVYIFGQIMTSNAPLLKRLRIELPGIAYTDEIAIPESREVTNNLVALKDFSIFIDTKFDRPESLPAVFTKYSEFFSRYHPILPPSIETISMEISYLMGRDSWDDFVDLVLKFNDALQSIDDDVLSDRRRFPYLEKIDVHFFVYGKYGDWYRDRGFPSFKFKRLSSNGVALNTKLWVLRVE